MKYFTIEELTYSATAIKEGIDNTPDASVKSNLKRLIENLLDPIRADWGKPITVTSGYRCKALNDAVGGVVNSEHMSGNAADITAGDRQKNLLLFNQIKSNKKLHFRQLIDESSLKWIHISYNPADNKMQILAL